jgi:hypothetical protein
MNQNLDKNKIRDSILRARPQDLLYLTINPEDKDSHKKAIDRIKGVKNKKEIEILIIKH